MSPSNQDLGAWFLTPAGQYLLAWERAQFEETVADIFGYHALQLGVTALDTLKTSRMPHRWLAAGERQWRTTQPAGHAADGSTNRPADPVGHSQVESQNQDHVPEHLAGASDTSVIEGAAGPATRRVVLYSDFSALPFQAASLDLVVLAHALELNADPHATLREVERVLMPEGRVVISGLNPASLWAMRQRQAHGVRHLGVGRLFLPEEGDFIGYRRLRDWLRLLSFEVETGRFGCYRPALQSKKWLQRLAWLDRVGARWWPIFGAVYFLVAVKRVRGMRLFAPRWKPVRQVAGAPVSVARRADEMRVQGTFSSFNRLDGRSVLAKIPSQLNERD